MRIWDSLTKVYMNFHHAPQYLIMRTTKYIIHKRSMIILMSLFCQRSCGCWPSNNNNLRDLKILWYCKQIADNKIFRRNVGVEFLEEIILSIFFYAFTAFFSNALYFNKMKYISTLIYKMCLKKMRRSTSVSEHIIPFRYRTLFLTYCIHS